MARQLLEKEMASPPPLAFDTTYHIYNRGNNRENLFRSDKNYRHFLRLYAKYIMPIADTFAYCLLPNHFHLLIRTKTPEEQEQIQKTDKGPKPFKILNPSQQFSNLFNAYTKTFNNRYRRTGSLFEHPFGRIPVTSDAYFTQLVAYIHQNPQRHRLIDDFRNWPYSSYRALLSSRPTRLQREVVLDWFEGQQQLETYHQMQVNEAAIESFLMEDFEYLLSRHRDERSISP